MPTRTTPPQPVALIAYTNLCDTGHKIDRRLTHAQGRVEDLAPTVAYDDEAPAEKRQRLIELKRLRDQARIDLSHHAAHCTNGCTRAPDQTFEVRGWKQSAAAKTKPDLPPLEEIAARIRGGEKVADLGREYGRTSLRSILNMAGYSALTGHKLTTQTTTTTATATPRRGDEWQDDALCAQVDPALFFPEAGGSTRLAKRLCGTCPVQTECAQAAEARGEQWGIWGGINHADRRYGRNTSTSQPDTAA